MRTLGIDLASQPADTAIAGIEWPEGDVPRLIPFSQLESQPFTDERLIDLLNSQEWGRIAVDVPFGWPRSLLGLLERWRIGIPVELPADMRAGHSEALFRATDLVVWEQTGVRPSPVGLDKLAWVALRGFHILSAAGAHTDRAGLRSAVIETYPKAALTRWSDMPATSTKSGDDAPSVRADVVDRISAELALQIESEDRDQLVAAGRDHRFDAFLCALVARAAMLGRTTLPRPGQERELSDEEGWIHLPQEGSTLKGLASPSYETVDLPDRFMLDSLEPNGEWLTWGQYEAGLFERLPDGSYVCAGHGGSPTWIRCVYREDERLHVIDGAGAPFIYRVRAGAAIGPSGASCV